MPRWRTELKIEGNRVVELKKLTKFGNGYVLVLPKDWVRAHCGTEHQVEIDVEGGAITITGYKGGES